MLLPRAKAAAAETEKAAKSGSSDSSLSRKCSSVAADRTVRFNASRYSSVAVAKTVRRSGSNAVVDRCVSSKFNSARSPKCSSVAADGTVRFNGSRHSSVLIEVRCGSSSGAIWNRGDNSETATAEIAAACGRDSHSSNSVKVTMKLSGNSNGATVRHASSSVGAIWSRVDSSA